MLYSDFFALCEKNSQKPLINKELSKSETYQDVSKGIKPFLSVLSTS